MVKVSIELELVPKLGETTFEAMTRAMQRLDYDLRYSLTDFAPRSIAFTETANELTKEKQNET